MSAPNLARISPDRTVREEIKLLTRLGWNYQGTNSAGHLTFHHAQYGDLTTSATPRNPRRWKVYHRRDVARAMGLSLWQFERHIAGQSTTKRPARERKRRASEPRRPVSLRVAPDPEPVNRTLSQVGELRAWFHRCRECAMPWHLDSRAPASACPRCGSRRIVVNPPREAAA